MNQCKEKSVDNKSAQKTGGSDWSKRTKEQKAIANARRTEAKRKQKAGWSKEEWAEFSLKNALYKKRKKEQMTEAEIAKQRETDAAHKREVFRRMTQQEKDEYNKKQRDRRRNMSLEQIEARREYMRRYEKHRMSNDPLYKLSKNLRQRLRTALKRTGDIKKDKTMNLVGCDLAFLRAYLEARFTKEMSWDNHGKIWHIDHIIPMASFDLSKKSEQNKCCHYTNLQPMLAFDNISKGCKAMKQQSIFDLEDPTFVQNNYGKQEKQADADI